AGLVDQVLLVGGDVPAVVVGLERLVHRLERVERELGASVEARIREEWPTPSKDGVVLNVRAQTGKPRRAGAVPVRPVLLKPFEIEARLPGGHADTPDPRPFLPNGRSICRSGGTLRPMSLREHRAPQQEAGEQFTTMSGIEVEPLYSAANVEVDYD